MQAKPLRTLAIASVLAGAFGLSAAAAAGDPGKAPPMDHAAMGHSAGSMELHKIMGSAHASPKPLSDSVDRDYAKIMTMHHQQAIEMNAVLLKHGKNPELRALAEKMTAAQKREIEELKPHTR